MCTIGNVFSNGNLDIRYNTVFKQCDLQDQTVFISPVVSIDSGTGIRYVAFTRKKPDNTTPAWAGINEYGISFVAADSYLMPSAADNINALYTNVPKEASVFDMYLSLISQCKTLDEAVQKANDFYQNMKQPTDTDILLVADANRSCFIETYAGAVRCIERTDKFFVSTNHMRMFYGAADYEHNHSTHLRLQRAETVLAGNPTHSGVGDLLRDTYYGESVWSICRSKEITVAQETPFFTQASVIFNVPNAQDSAGKRDSLVEFVINGKPDEAGKGIAWRPFSSTYQTPVDYIGKGNI
jgi:hypothetical protein